LYIIFSTFEFFLQIVEKLPNQSLYKHLKAIIFLLKAGNVWHDIYALIAYFILINR